MNSAFKKCRLSALCCAAVLIVVFFIVESRGQTSATNTVTNGGTIDSGTTEIITNPVTSITGDITNNGSLQFWQSESLSNPNIISGTGSLAQAGAGTTTLAGTNSYTGSTTVSGGTLFVSGLLGSDGTYAGLITNNAALVFGNAGLQSLTGELFGSGSLTMRGAGTVSYTGAGTTNFYTGNVTIESGTFHTSMRQEQPFEEGHSYNGQVEIWSGATFSVTGRRYNMGGSNPIAFTTDGAGTADISVKGAGGLVFTNNVTISSLGGAQNRITNTAATDGFNIGSGATVTYAVTRGTDATADLAVSIPSFSAGAVRKTGDGILLLSGASTYGGGTTIDQGTVAIANNAAFGFGAVTFASNAIVNSVIDLSVGNAYTIATGAVATFTQSANTALTNAGVISGGGSLVQDGSGSLVLINNNSYSGTTTVNGGTLQLGAGGSAITAGIGDIFINNGSTLAIRGARYDLNTSGGVSRTITFDAGGGNTIDTGSGVNVVDWMGTTYVTLGGAQNVISGASGFNLNSSAVATFNVARGTDATTDLLFSARLWNLGSMVKTGDGIMTMSGTNTYSGTTTIAESILRAGAAGTFSGTSATTLSNLAGVTLDLDGYNNSVGSLAGGGTTGGHVTLGSGTLTVGGNGTSTTYGGVVSGTGGLVKTGAGTQTLIGANTYSGTTTISGGALQVGDGGTNGNLGTAAVVNNSSLILNRGDAYTLTNAISGSGSLTKLANSTTTLTGNNTYGGSTTISAGTLRVGNGGTNGSLGTGAIFNNGAVIFNRSDSLTVGGTITGTGTLSVNSGQLVLNGGGYNYYGGGGVFINNGSTLSFAGSRYDLNLQGSGAVKTFTFDANGGNTFDTGTGVNLVDWSGNVFTTLGGARNFITGASGINTAAGTTVTLDVARGTDATTDLLVSAAFWNGASLLKTGNGIVTLTGSTHFNGSVPYAGATIISNGTLQIGNGGTTGTLGLGNVTNNASLVFNRSDSQVIANTISGTGSLTHAGSGTTTLTGNNTYSGGTTVAAGRLVGTTESLQGAIANEGQVEFNQSTSGTYSNAISGAGSMIKSGAGTVTLTASNSYTGTTTVSGGGIVLNGSIASSTTTVQNGGWLGGSGTVGSLTIESGGTVAPGNSPGTLNINGDINWLGGGNYNWQIVSAEGMTPGTDWDFQLATGELDLSALTVSSQFNINLWSLESTAPDVSGALADFNPNKSYTWTILTATGGIIGYTGNEQFAVNTAGLNGTDGFANALAEGWGFSVLRDGNNLNLVYAQQGPGPEPIPEPGTWAAAALLAGGAAFMRWRKRAKVS